MLPPSVMVLFLVNVHCTCTLRRHVCTTLQFLIGSSSGVGPGPRLEDISYVWSDPPSALLCKYSAFMSGHIIHISHVCANSTKPPLTHSQAFGQYVLSENGDKENQYFCFVKRFRQCCSRTPFVRDPS